MGLLGAILDFFITGAVMGAGLAFGIKSMKILAKIVVDNFDDD